MEKRNKNIKKYRDKGWSYREIGAKYSISKERVRQILNNENSITSRRLKIKQLRKDCKQRFKNNVSQKTILEDIKDLSKPNRDQESVIKRDALIIYLYDELQISFPKIGALLNRNHTTIMHSYKKNHGKA